ncbi:YdgH/BhsA/McbA-like domain containing protein [Erwinia sp. V71]|uniref:YdgH/BhsA/McbA-like domain containing protein n=1 Tax=Erwinia sp. V71 TaxID=3369424 RepID=UPI003F62417F
MKSIKTFVAVSVLSLISFGSFAQTISATGRSLDDAESVIAAKAQAEGASGYRVISAQANNLVYMTAELTK